MTYDITIIRPEMKADAVRPRGRDLDETKRKALKKGLRALHSLEIMATKIYKCQITSEPSELNTALTAAMCNEMTHMQDFQTKLYEYGFKPDKFRVRYWVAGYVFGLGSRMLGRERMLKTGIWVETKAVHHYGELLNGAEWDAETRVFIEKDWADEYGHIARWKELLEHPGGMVDARSA
jgi:demethoxyubiquinone hydroxylase (CLK1/Coq7/Cat5 family)